ncbi:uncharacterized protein LOC133206080 [Saccostrea echinata]|uniref:uncharacterized protein LOC133196786 n=1 Tax=Saccostrea echinata TaxID=191078 RepID=UPI002A813F55|nr:uncharacterized protein LOC133196786 [Saccostrea echinata]XP_061197994.1 uncharacterized protein LOC133206080 [Saccostrea echinata]
MPLKKKGKKKPKSSKRKDDKQDAALGDDGDPGTLIADGTTDLGKEGKKKKGRKKKAKLSKSEKVLEKLEKACDKLKNQREFYHDFIQEMDRWLVRHSDQIVEMFKEFDEEGDGFISYDDFKSGMFDAGLTLNDTQVHLLAKLLDKDNSGDIDYTEISKGLQYAKELEEIDREAEEAEKILIVLPKKSEKCQDCKMGIDKPYRNKNPKYIWLELRLVTFDRELRNHPAHLEVMVQADATIYSILQLITKETGILSTKLSVFSDDSRSREAMLVPEYTLQELGYEGDSQDDPQEVTLYYDYKVEFTECPILLCDHYLRDGDD